MKIVHLEIPGEAIGKQRPRATNKGGYVRIYTPKETINYESYVKALFVQNYPEFIPLDIPLKINIVIIRTIPKSVSQKIKDKMLSGEIKVMVKPDLDNVVKTIFDALNRITYTDDNLISEVYAKKIYGEIPKVIIEIESY